MNRPRPEPTDHIALNLLTMLSSDERCPAPAKLLKQDTGLSRQELIFAREYLCQFGITVIPGKAGWYIANKSAKRAREVAEKHYTEHPADQCHCRLCRGVPCPA